MRGEGEATSPLAYKPVFNIFVCTVFVYILDNIQLSYFIFRHLVHFVKTDGRSTPLRFVVVSGLAGKC